MARLCHEDGKVIRQLRYNLVFEPVHPRRLNQKEGVILVPCDTVRRTTRKESVPVFSQSLPAVAGGTTTNSPVAVSAAA